MKPTQQGILQTARFGDGLRILSLLEQIQVLARDAFNIQLQTHSEKSLERFLSLPDAQQLLLESQLQNALSIFCETAAEGSLDSTRETQIRCTRKALWKYGFFSKHDWENYVETGDVIEIYDFTNTQIYRNLEFLRFCSYDFLEVMTNEWYVLWDRPERVIDDLKNWVGAVYEAASPVMVKIPEHMMREKGAAQRAFITSFKWFIPLFKAGQSEPAAFINVMAGCEVDSESAKGIRFLGRAAV